jgi:hypothetical protein
MEYVYTNKSIPINTCQSIIQKYEEHKEQVYPGVTGSGLNKNIKDTNDLMIPDTDEWDEINTILSNELTLNLKKYTEQIEQGENYKKDKNYGQEFNHLDPYVFIDSCFMIQKYDKQKGKYVYHNDSLVLSDKSRVITFLWYLNDITEGGETEFFGGSTRIIPEAGKILLFPALWTYPHRGNVPISSDKYIITGWLYSKNMQKRNISIPSVIIEKSSNNVPNVQKSLFELFYSKNKSVFMDYKCKVKDKERIIKNVNQHFYSYMTCSWIIEKIKNIHVKTEINMIGEINTFLISSFVIIIEKLKLFYDVECTFRVSEWYALPYIQEDIFETTEYDLCIQIDLSTGISYVSTKYIPIQFKYSIVYFIQYTLEYTDANEEKKTFLLKEIADPFLDCID